MAFERIGDALALDFVNTVHRYGADEPEDDLATPADFAAWCTESGLPRPRALGDAAALREAKSLRAMLRALFAAAANGSDLEAPLRPLNAALRRYGTTLALRVDGDGVVAEMRSAHGGAVLHAILADAVRLFTSGDYRRLRECASESCTWLFLDRSRNGTRRWCDMATCGNREKSRRFQERAARP